MALSVFGVAGSLFKINKSDGGETRYAGRVHNVTDIAACPYSVVSETGYRLLLSLQRYAILTLSATGQVQSGPFWNTQLPQGFELVGVVPLTLWRHAETPAAQPGRIENMSIPAGWTAW